MQSFFDANQERVPGDGIHNEINTRRELEAYDPALVALVAEYVPDAWTPECLAGR